MRRSKTALLGLLIALPLAGCGSVASTFFDPKPYGGVREDASFVVKNPGAFSVTYFALDVAPSFAVDTLVFPFTVSTLFLPMNPHGNFEFLTGNLHR